MSASRMSWKGRTFDSRRDWTFSEIHRRVDWDIVGLLAGTGLDRVITNPCPREADICLSHAHRIRLTKIRVPGPVLKTGGGLRAARGFESHGFRLAGPGYANGRAARLKPGCLWVRIPPWVLGHGAMFRLGRQWADHSRLEREMLRVRLPPEPSDHAFAEQPGVLATLSRWRSRVRIPPGRWSERTARYANRQSGPAQTRGFCGFDSHPCYSRLDCSGGVPHGGL